MHRSTRYALFQTFAVRALARQASARTANKKEGKVPLRITTRGSPTQCNVKGGEHGKTSLEHMYKWKLRSRKNESNAANSSQPQPRPHATGSAGHTGDRVWTGIGR